MQQALFMTCREGKTTWQDLDLDDIDLRLKWSGLFHRRKRTPGFFMMRLKVTYPAPPFLPIFAFVCVLSYYVFVSSFL